MWRGYLADLIVAFHSAYVGYVVFGFLAILVGAALGWKWVGNRWFRCSHLVMITIVAVEAIFGWECPLTTWEAQLRQAAGQQVSDGTFMGRLMHHLIFIDSVPPWVLHWGYIAFALLVAATFWFAPVRWRGGQASKGAALPAPPVPEEALAKKSG